MKRSIFLLLIVFLYAGVFNAQLKYGNATIEELQMEAYPQDTTAAAVILLKKGDTRFVYSTLYGFQYEYTLQVKIKILKQEGLEWCDQKISYYYANSSLKEDINGLSGTTYNLEDGKIIKTKLSKEHIFEEDTDKKWRIRKFTMPAAKVGSVVEYKFTLVSDFFHDLRDFYFQASIPIAYASYEVKIPEYYRYNINTLGYIRVNGKQTSENESFNVQHRDQFGKIQPTLRCTAEKYFFEAKDVPAIKDEAYLWTVNNYVSKVTFELKSINMPYSHTKNITSSWQNIDKEILGSDSYSSDLKKSGLFKNEIAETEISLTRASQIQNMIKEKVKWNDKETFFPKDIKDVLKNGTGSSADINFLLINALKAGGFDAFPVILSTRKNGFLPITHPSITAFNYVITGIKMDTVTYFTDAAEKYGDWNLLPEKCMVPQARILKQDNCSWVDLQNISTGSVLQTASIHIDDSRLIHQITDTSKGNAAINVRKNYTSYSDQNDYIESIQKRLGGEIDSFRIEKLDATNEPLKISYRRVSEIDTDSEFIYVNPIIDQLYADNPFKRETREFPVEFNYLMNFVQIIDFTIPEGYEVDELPRTEKIVFSNNDIILTYRIAQTGQSIKTHFQYQLRRLQFLPTEYESIRDFFAKVAAKNSEQIVLKRIATI